MYALLYDRSQQKPINNIISGKVAVGVARDSRFVQGVHKLYMAYHAVIFAFARLTCYWYQPSTVFVRAPRAIDDPLMKSRKQPAGVAYIWRMH